MIKWKRPRVHASGNFFKDVLNMFHWLGKKKGGGGGRLSKFFAKFMQEMRRE
jgi:hypothetical protein